MDITAIAYIYIIIALLVASAYSLASLRAIFARDKSQRGKQIANSYVEQIIASQICNESDSKHTKGYDSALSAGDITLSTSQRMALAEAIYLIMSHTYSTPTEVIKPLVAKNRLEELLLRRLHKSDRIGKTKLLNFMSCIPIGSRTAEEISQYLYSNDRHIRIAALIATLAAYPNKAIRIIAELPYRLKPYDTARIVALLRRGLLPIAYEPLLMSDNYNLLMLGIAITNSFGIDIADRHLHNILLRHKSPTIVREAIYTLTTLRQGLGYQHIKEQLASMPPAHRRELCHHLSCEGYSLSALRVIFSKSETKQAKSLINSYKRDLICQQSY